MGTAACNPQAGGDGAPDGVTGAVQLLSEALDVDEGRTQIVRDGVNDGFELLVLLRQIGRRPLHRLDHDVAGGKGLKRADFLPQPGFFLGVKGYVFIGAVALTRSRLIKDALREIIGHASGLIAVAVNVGLSFSATRRSSAADPSAALELFETKFN